MTEFIYTKPTFSNYTFNLGLIFLFQVITYVGIADTLWFNLFQNNSLFKIIVGYGFSFYLITFWCISIAYLLLDIYKYPKFLYNYKVQPNTNITLKDIKKASLVVIRNQFCGVLPILYVYYYYLKKYNFSYNPHHSVLLDMTHFFCFCILEEIWFYTFHRLAHNKYLYKHIHKKHHEYKAPFCLTSQYCSLIEQIFINIIPLVLGPFIMKSHPHCILMWISLSIVSALNSHSDYNFPYMASVIFHDFHHYNFNCNYGAFLFMDRIFDTDREYINFINRIKNK
jgi:fatty acid hydroxylase domain-containing protein 2